MTNLVPNPEEQAISDSGYTSYLQKSKIPCNNKNHGTWVLRRHPELNHHGSLTQFINKPQSSTWKILLTGVARLTAEHIQINNAHARDR